jgi:hypothetical protein
MSQKYVVAWIALVLAALACAQLPSSSGDENSQVTAVPVEDREDFMPDEDTEMAGRDHFIANFSIPAGVVVTVQGDAVIYVAGDTEIAGVLQSECGRLELRGDANLMITGQISNSCTGGEAGPEMVLVGTGDITIGAPGVTTPVLVSSGDVTVADPGGLDLEIEAVGGEDISIFRTAPKIFGRPVAQGTGTTTLNGPITAGPGGRIRAPRASGNLAVNASQTGEDGAPGADLTADGNCDASANRGKPGGSIHLAAPNGTLNLGVGVILKAGAGGKGGDCTAAGEGIQTAIAGPGGRGGTILIGGRGIVFGAGVVLQRGNGGPGGTASAEAGHGLNDCESGFAATATGGEGGKTGGIGYAILEPGTITGPQPSVEGGSGGKGGFAGAIGGDGADCSVCPGGQGGAGGAATTTGGQGGDGATRSLGWPITGGHQAGDGGGALALGGLAGDGATCCDPADLAGAGGDGGATTATGGQPGDKGKEPGERGRSTDSISGDGGDGGDGSLPGVGGLAGEGVGDPDVVELGFDGIDGGGCFKIWDVFIGLLQGDWQHFSSSSEVLVLILVLGNDPVPVPNAEVTVSMTSSSGAVETQTGVTDSDGEVEFAFPISSYDNYTVQVESIAGENMLYVPKLNTATTVAVNVNSNPSGLTNGAARIQDFFGMFNDAFQNGDTAWLYSTLHPAVIERYGEAQCRAYLDEVVQNPIALSDIRVSGYGVWDYPIDERISLIENAYTVQGTLTAGDQTGQAELHIALYGAAEIGWFTDCGDPLD